MKIRGQPAALEGVRYSFFNAKLFANSLPDLLVTLERHRGAKGHFAPERFSGRVEKITAHELALNPDVFAGRSDELILSTLVHEMAHVWQETHGTPPRRSYHDREWAAKMKEIGLQPSTTGGPGGKEIGQSVTHYILSDGRFAHAYAELAASGFRLNWQSVPFNGRESEEEDCQPDQVHLPKVWYKRLGQASDEANLWGMLPRQWGRHSPIAISVQGATLAAPAGCR